MVLVYSGERPVGFLDYNAMLSGTCISPSVFHIVGDRVTAESDSLKIEDDMQYSGGLMVIVRRWTAKRPGKWQFSFKVSSCGEACDRLIIPAVMYHDNVEGKGKFPRGGLQAGWSFREDRMPIPSCAVLYGEGSYFAVFTEPARDEKEISSIRACAGPSGPACEIRVPFSEGPFSYCEKGLVIGGLRKARQRHFNISDRQLPFTYERKFFIRAGRYTGNIFHVFKGLTRDAFGEAGGGKVCGRTDWGKIASLKLHNMLFLTVDDREKGIAGIQQGKGNPPHVQHAHENVAGSFLSRGMEGAYIYARLGLELKSERLLSLSERIGRFFLRGEMENGLHQDFYKFSEKRMSGYHMPLDAGTREMREGANARCNGEAMLNYLRLYRELKNAGRDVPEFLGIARRNAAFYISCQLSGDRDGSFGRWWGRDGRPINSGGTNGAHIIPFLVELEKAGVEVPGLQGALKRAVAYYGSLVRHSEYYGDSLDADCTDKEAGVVLLRAFLDLYERDRNREYLELAADAASYVLSWTWTYDVPFGKSTPLGRQGFRTTGMTAVSVAHHHLDFYGLSPAFDLLRLWEATGDTEWKRYAIMMVDCCSQLISSAGNLLGRPGQFTGYQPEQVNQTAWNYLLLELGGKGTWNTCIAWVVVLTLGAMLDIRQRFPVVLDFSPDRELLRRLDPGIF